MILPLPAVALDVSKVLAPLQNDALPMIAAVGSALMDTANAADVNVQVLLLVMVTV